MKKIYILSGLMCLLPGLSFGENPRIAELTRSKQEKMERLQKCEGTTKALKIAGLSTIGLTAVGVVGNVVEAQKLQTYQGQSNALDTQIAQTKKEIEDKKAEIKTNKAEPTEPTNPAETSTTSTTSTTTATSTTTPTTTGLADVDKEKDGTSQLSWNFYGYCDDGSNDPLSATSCGDLSAKGQWKVVFDYGTVWGEASCNTTSARDPWQEWSVDFYILQLDGERPADAMSSTSNGRYCWCRATKFGEQNYASSSWVFNDVFDSASVCEKSCATFCASHLNRFSAFRKAVFAGAGN